MRKTLLVLSMVSLMLAACPGGDGGTKTDAGTPDGGRDDAGAPDAGDAGDLENTVSGSAGFTVQSAAASFVAYEDGGLSTYAAAVYLSSLTQDDLCTYLSDAGTPPAVMADVARVSVFSMDDSVPMAPGDWTTGLDSTLAYVRLREDGGAPADTNFSNAGAVHLDAVQFPALNAPFRFDGGFVQGHFDFRIEYLDGGNGEDTGTFNAHGCSNQRPLNG